MCLVMPVFTLLPARLPHGLPPHLLQVYEDQNYVCLVMPMCSGGELLDAIAHKGSYSERDAAKMLRTIIDVVAHCHRMGVIHRDIKVRGVSRWACGKCERGVDVSKLPQCHGVTHRDIKMR